MLKYRFKLPGLLLLLHLSCFSVLASENGSEKEKSKQKKATQPRYLDFRYMHFSEKSMINNSQSLLKVIVYEHQQGFFCDFEDQLSKKRKFNIDLGITGDQ